MRKEFKIDDVLRGILNNEYATTADLVDYFLSYHLEEVDVYDYDLEFLDEKRNLTSSLNDAVYVLVELY